MGSVGALIAVKAGIPPNPRTLEFQTYRQKLPIFKQRTEILEKIRMNRFTVIKGATGSGKTTQVPQYILEEASALKQPVRIIVCIPRRVGVVAVCDRVTEERGERVGYTVGYTIRLESCTSPCETLLTFCTGPILVGALSSPGCKLLETTTHIILDEVHARDSYTDFLLACCHGIADFFPKMKFVFLGENCQLDFLRDYFAGYGSYDEVLVEGRDHGVKILFLEQVLELVEKSVHLESNRKKSLTLCTQQQNVKNNNHCKYNKYEIDKLIENAWKDHNYDASLAQFMQLVKVGEVSVDYQHSKTSLTMLMAVSGGGRVDTVKMLIKAGANLLTRSLNGYTAIDWAKSLSQIDVLRQLEWEQLARSGQTATSRAPLGHVANFPGKERIEVNLNLIRELIHMLYVCDTTGGSILVYLPTYDDMVSLKKMLCDSSDPQMGSEFFVVYYLHPHIQTGDHRAAFEKPKPGVRKIILSTSVGESCLTFDDVVFVIDSGINREYSYDSVTGVNVLKQCWISKSVANQRKGRAGRTAPGICYRLYSEKCYYQDMQNFSVPEIGRAPLSSLCLQSRAIIGYDIPISDFFASFPNPPPIFAVQKAVETLKSMGALDEREQLTDLGVHLLDYPINPALGKAILYSVVFKCMDPVLTLVAAISYGDTFTHQTDPKFKNLAHNCKVTLADGTLSDHMAVIKSIQEWEETKCYRDGDDEEYCKNNYLSAPAFEIIYSIRSRLLGHLRAAGFVRNKGVGDVKYLNANSDNWAMVKGVLTAAFYPNIGLANHRNQTLFNNRFDEIHFDGTSVLSNLKSDWFKELPSDWAIYDELIPDGCSQAFIKGCTLVSSTSIALFAGNSLVSFPLLSSVMNEHDHAFSCRKIDDQKHEPRHCVKIDNWPAVLSLGAPVDEVISLREKVRETVLRRLRKPASFPSKDDQSVIANVARILTVEDTRIGLKTANVGQWPKLVSGNLMSTPRSGFEIIHEKH